MASLTLDQVDKLYRRGLRELNARYAKLLDRRRLKALLRERAEEMRRRSWPGQKYTSVDSFVTAPRKARHGNG